MTAYLSRYQLVTAAIESVPGVDVIPTPGANAIRMEDPTSRLDGRMVTNNEVTATLDRLVGSPAGGTRRFTGRSYIRGSGTAIQPPRLGTWLRSVGMAQDILAADASGVLVAATANGGTLAASASAVPNIYRGYVLQVTAGVGINQKRIVTGNAADRTFTVSPPWDTVPTAATVAIKAGVRYRTQSALMPSLSVYKYMLHQDGTDAQLQRMLGARGNGMLNLSVGAQCFWDFDHTGKMQEPEATATPAVASFDSLVPPPFIAAEVYFNGIRAAAQNFTVNLGNIVNAQEDPNELYGFATADMTERAVTGTLRLPKERTTVRNSFELWRTGTEMVFTAIWGSVAGNWMALLVPSVVLTSVDDVDVTGKVNEDLPWGVNRADDNVMMTFW